MSFLTLTDISKTFKDTAAVVDFNLDVPRGEFVSFLGPSGCGKTTTLRMIAGFETPTTGTIVINGEDITYRPPNRRNVGMVFQSYALFPNMTVAGNIGFGLKVTKRPPAEIQKTVAEMLDVIHLPELGARYPYQLSGGQQQRVALARALAIHPKVLLLDEPLSALDAKIRVELRSEIRRIQQELGITTIYVTHDQEEALSLSDRIVVMNGGRIEQIGTPQEMYEQPQSRFVAGFIGSPSMNFIPCRLIEISGRFGVAIAGGPTLAVPPARTERYRPHLDREMILGIRPEHCIEFRPHEENSHWVDFQARVEVVEPLGMDTMVHFKFAGKSICSLVDPYAVKNAGETIRFMIDMKKMHLIDPKTDKVV